MFSCHSVAVLIYLGNNRFWFDLFTIVYDTVQSPALTAICIIQMHRGCNPHASNHRHVPLWGRGRGSSQRGLETDGELRAGSYRPAVYRNWASDPVQSSRDRPVLAVET